MGTKQKTKKDYLELVSMQDEPFQKYLDTLPEMIEEHKEMRIMRGSDIIAELNSQGKEGEAQIYEPNKHYQRVYTTLKKMDHLSNAKKAFKKNGIPGLEKYRKQVREHAYKMKGKYPQFFLGTDTPKKGENNSFAYKVKQLYQNTINKINATINPAKSTKPNQRSSKVLASKSR